MSIQKMEVEGWHSERPLRLLHLGDLHMERVTSRELELNRMVGELNPDLILFSGDILNLSYLEDPRSIEDARQVISGWHAPLGVYIVAGSPAVDLPESLAAILDGLDVHFLNNQAIQLDFEGNPLTLIGLQSTQRPYIEGPILSGLVKEENPGSFKILLYHTPDLAPEASACGINLQLSGHTHGGQVRLPLIGALMTGSLYGKKFEAGRYKVGKTVLYVTRGIGMEGGGAPRVRFLCPPEVILWEISGKTG
jgi:predicted MPP superfamily phosphohydrolase